jgi:hypothetical protein
MRTLLALVLAVAFASVVVAQAEKRYGIDADLKTYPQATSKQTLASVLKAIENKRVDYLLAHLAEPEWVDRRVKDTGGKFSDLVEETKGKLVDDPASAKLLQRFLKEGDWEVGDSEAEVSLKDVKDHVVAFHKVEGRWFMENRNSPKEKK